jgi:hypothetical protein
MRPRVAAEVEDLEAGKARTAEPEQAAGEQPEAAAGQTEAEYIRAMAAAGKLARAEADILLAEAHGPADGRHGGLEAGQ